jgi:putative membrane protein insertion efficiency factor
MKKAAIFLISLYQKVSHLFPTQCIYQPTCSQYAKEAFRRYSFLRAFLLTGLRILRCNPLAKGGFDPVE